MTIASEISRLQSAKADIKASIEGKGITVPNSATLDDYASYIDLITCETIPVSYDTFTIQWTENSDPASFNPQWSDGAAGLTAGSTEFDKFFGYYGVRLSDTGQETAKVTQSTPGTLDITGLGDLTTGNNVMIAFPRLGYKMSKSNSTVTLSITNDPNKDGFKYYAFTKGTTSKNTLYLGAYEMTENYTSLSGKSPLVKMTRANFRTNTLKKYGTSSGYSLMTYRPRDLIKILYMMKYGNPDSQSVVGKGLTSGSSAATGVTNSITDATGSTDKASSGGRIKLFGLEDIWGNVSEWMDGCYFNSSTHLTVDDTNSIFQDSAYSTDLGAASSGYLAGIDGSSEGTFRNISTSGGSASAYYCDYSSANTDRVLGAGGHYFSGGDAGVFCVGTFTASIALTHVGSRLQFL